MYVFKSINSVVMFNNLSSLITKINFIKLSKHNMGYVSNCK